MKKASCSVIITLLNLFSRCFNLKDLNLNKHFEHLREDLLFTLQYT